LRQEVLDWAMRIPGLQCYLFRRTYPELEKNHIIPSLNEFPKGVGVFKKQDKRWELKNGSMIHFCHSQYESDIYQYQGAEIHLLGIDELTTFTELMYDYLRSRVRCTLPIPDRLNHKIPGIVCCSNPGGIGHEFAKRRWVDFAKPLEYKRTTENEGGMLRCYIPAKVTDNPILMKRDPGYVSRLKALPEPFRTAYLEGDWELFMGAAFNFNVPQHVCRPRPIPQYVPIYMTLDWGYQAPSAVLWFWMDNDSRLYLFHEWYTWNGTPNQGLRLTDSELAGGIKERERQLGLNPANIQRLCDPTCFNKKPDYKGGGQGPSTYEVFLKHDLTLMPGDANRKLKIRQFHERLRVPEDGTLPMFQVYPECENFIRTIPLMQTDPKRIEDIVTVGVEDHIYDSACHAFMARPIGVHDEESRAAAEEEAREVELSKLDDTSRAASESIRRAWEEAQEEQQYDDLWR